MSSNAKQSQSSDDSAEDQKVKLPIGSYGQSPPESSLLTERSLTIATIGAWKPHMEVYEGGKTKYFIGIHRANRPDLRLRHGHDRGALAAVSHIHSWTRVYHIGLGSDEHSMQWVDFDYKAWQKEPTFKWKDETYVMSRTSTDENGEKLEHTKLWFHVGVTDSTEQRVATHSTRKEQGKRKCFLNFAQGVSQELELLIVLGICSWKEEMRRAG